jgi:hypothetical protein
VKLKCKPQNPIPASKTFPLDTDSAKLSAHTIDPSSASLWSLPSAALNRCFAVGVILCTGIAISGCGGVVVNETKSTPSQGSFNAVPNAVDFGSVSVGNSANSKITMVNSTSSVVTVSKLAVSNGSFSVDGSVKLPVALSAGSTQQLMLHYKPSAQGTSSGTLTITSNAKSAPTTTVQLKGNGKQSSPTVATATPSDLTCTSSSITGDASDNCTVSLTAEAPAGGLSVTLASNSSDISVPGTVTVAAGATSASFNASASAVASAQTVTMTASANGGSQSTVILLNPSGILSAMSCGSSSLSGASTDACTVTLNGAAPSGGVTVSLTSNSSSVSIPSKLSIAAGKTGSGFAATASAVSSSKSVLLTANVGGVTKTFSLKLVPSVPTMSWSANSLSFNNVGINTTDSQSVTLKSVGTASLTISSASVTGKGFSVTSAGLPVTLSPGQSTHLSVQFTPTSAGSVSGQLAISSNSSTGSSTKIVLAGTGATSIGAPTLSGLNCSTSSYTAAGTDSCTVTLSGAAPSGGLSVSLSSNSSSVTVPSSVSVTSGASSASFTATVAAVTSSQTATLTANAGSVSKTFALSLSTSGSGNGGHNYSTTFPLTENPISENGNWINGGTTGLDWHDCASTGGSPGFAYGTEPGTVNYDDTSCVLTGTWGSSQSAQITVKVNSTSGASYQEVEVRLRTTIVAHSITGYEINCSVIPGNPYMQIVRWNGPLGSFTELNGTSTGCTTGDVLMATISGSTITAYKNGNAVMTATDSTYTGGSPGMGFYIQNPNGSASAADSDFGATAFSATDSLSSGSSSSSTSVTPASLSCSSSSITGAGSTACTVTLSAAAPTGGLALTLASSSTAVSLPASVTVPAGSTSASVTATVAAVSSTQTASLTASANGATASFPLQLKAASALLSINATSISFGNVVLSAPATQTLTLSSTGSAAVTVNSAVLTGLGFSISGATFPLTLNPGQTASLNVQFETSVAGIAAGVLTLTSTSASAPTTVIALSATGVAATVTLSWTAPVDPADPAVAYNVYRATGSSSTYQKLTSTADALTDYTDTSVASGSTYQYYVTSLDASGAESAPSATSSIAVP